MANYKCWNEINVQVIYCEANRKIAKVTDFVYESI